MHGRGALDRGCNKQLLSCSTGCSPELPPGLRCLFIKGHTSWNPRFVHTGLGFGAGRRVLADGVALVVLVWVGVCPVRARAEDGRHEQARRGAKKAGRERKVWQTRKD